MWETREVRARANGGSEGRKVCRGRVTSGIKRGRVGAVRNSRGCKSISGGNATNLVVQLTICLTARASKEYRLRCSKYRVISAVTGGPCAPRDFSVAVDDKRILRTSRWEVAYGDL